MARRPGGEAAIRSRLAASPGLSDAEAHTLAGFLDAESHLAVIPNNGGATWRCECSVNLRDDDREILISYRDKLGLGHLTQIAARNGSRPQVLWKISSKIECQALAEVLDEHPLRGRKRREYEIWREASMVWASRRRGPGPAGRVRLAQLAGYLLAERAYSDPPQDAVLPDMTDAYAPSYFAGFFSGEGSFRLARRHARFVIKLRRDDRPLLDAFCRDFDIGSVVDVAAIEPWSPAAVWHVIGARDVLKGIELFESAPLLGRKARQYRAWRPGAQAIAEAIIGQGPLDALLVDESRRALAHATAYRPPRTPLRTDPGLSAARSAYLQVLRQWANSVDGPLSCGAYASARRGEHPDWPKRETIAEAFGSWYDALGAAGFAARAARPRPTRPPQFDFERLRGPEEAAYRAAVVRRLRGLLHTA
jgi:LAGLIDADG endonuclease